MKYLGIDFGSKTVGLAISDPTGLIASPYQNIPYQNNTQLITALKSIINQEKIELLVLGLPKNMDNTYGESAKKVLQLKHQLETELNIAVTLQDERLSSKEGNNMLITGDISRAKRKKVIDKVAAAIFLQTFLDKERNK